MAPNTHSDYTSLLGVVFLAKTRSLLGPTKKDTHLWGIVSSRRRHMDTQSLFEHMGRDRDAN